MEYGPRKKGFIRKYFPVVDVSVDAPTNSEYRLAVVICNQTYDGGIIRKSAVIKKKPKLKARSIVGVLTAGLQRLLKESGKEWLEIVNKCLKERVFLQIWKEGTMD